jgi:hypothetical protein
VHKQRSPVDIQTATQWKLTGLSMTAPPPPCYRPTFIFRRLALIVLSFLHGNFGAISKNIIFYIFIS